jgi:hypothetical protein
MSWERLKTNPLAWLSLGLPVLAGVAYFFVYQEAPRAKPTHAPEMFSDGTNHLNDTEIGCSAMVEHHCDRLYSATHRGNARLRKRNRDLQVLQGKTPNNFTTTFYQFSMAKLKKREQFPKNFRTALEEHYYFERLERLLARPPRGQMTLDERLVFDREERDLAQLWLHAVSAATLRQLSSKFPDSYKLDEDAMPPEVALERQKIRIHVLSEVSRIMWADLASWRAVESDFVRLKKHFLELITQLDIDDQLRTQWQKRVQQVRLVVPGAIEGLADEECITTKRNAFYYANLNVITVCAGFFNSGDMEQVLAHELAHAIDVSTLRLQAQRESELGRKLSEIKEGVCGPRTFDCNTWNNFRETYDKRLEDMSRFDVSMSDFHQCLKRGGSGRTASTRTIRSVAESTITERVSDLVSNGTLLRMVKYQIPLSDRSLTKNPYYLNPCKYHPFADFNQTIDGEFTTLLFFTAAYSCGQGTSAAGLNSAVETATDMSKKLTEAVIRMEGEYSPRESLQALGISSPPTERFADVVGSYILARSVAEEKKIVDRRKDFLSSISWQCKPPSMATSFPSETEVLKSYRKDYGLYADTDARIKDALSAGMREALSCTKDFEAKDCDLPLKAPR